jgi:adenosyl cobinamide kinase/adenosyl cobinamide phosphate guanylyltransferase
VILLLGGARSGKSAAAVRLAQASGLPVTFIATAQAGDDEMAARIASHRARRPASWVTLEAPLDLQGALRAADSGHFLIVDCLTLWVSNLLGARRMDAEIDLEGARAAALLKGRRAVVVSNEVGLGIVPANELGRRYRDLLGGVNATFAEAASRSLFLVAGRALSLAPLDSLPADSLTAD